MDWSWLIAVPDNEDVAFVVMLSAAVGVVWWQMRRWRSERQELRTSKEKPVYEHRFECKPMLNRVQRERDILFIRHRAPAGVGEARARRVAAARAKLREQDLLHEES